MRLEEFNEVNSVVLCTLLCLGVCMVCMVCGLCFELVDVYVTVVRGCLSMCVGHSSPSHDAQCLAYSSII